MNTRQFVRSARWGSGICPLYFTLEPLAGDDQMDYGMLIALATTITAFLRKMSCP